MTLANNSPPIVYAVMAGDVDLVKQRIAIGCDPNYVDRAQSTALSQAVARNRSDIIDVLLTAGAKLEITDSYGKTAFDYIRTADMVRHFKLQEDPNYRWILENEEREREETVKKARRWSKLPPNFHPNQYDKLGCGYSEDRCSIFVATGRRVSGRWIYDDYDIGNMGCIGMRIDGVVSEGDYTLVMPLIGKENMCMEPHSIYQITGYLNVNNRRIGVDEIIGSVIDHDLKNLIAERTKPIAIDIDGFGTFNLNRDLGVFEGHGHIPMLFT